MLLSPFKDRYVLAGQAGVVAVAYAGHFLYGWPLGKFVQHLDNTDRELQETFRYPTPIVLGLVDVRDPAVAAAVAAVRGAPRGGQRLAHEAGKPVLLVAVGDAFTPEFARISPGECVLVVNHTDNEFSTKFGDVGARSQADFCFQRRRSEAREAVAHPVLRRLRLRRRALTLVRAGGQPAPSASNTKLRLPTATQPPGFTDATWFGTRRTQSAFVSLQT